MKNYYDVFGLPPTASSEDISAAHKALAKKYHPDINSSKDAHEKMTMLNRANEVLSDNTKRKKYDTELKQSRSQQQGKNIQSSQKVKMNRSGGIRDTEDRTGKAEILRKRAEERLKTEEAARVRREEHAQKKAEEKNLKRKQEKVDSDKQHVINMLSALMMKDNAQKSKKMDVDEERYYATKVLLSLIRNDDAHLRRVAEEAERKQRIEEILTLVKNANNEADKMV